MAGPAPTARSNHEDRSAGPVHSSGWLYGSLLGWPRTFVDLSKRAAPEENQPLLWRRLETQSNRKYDEHEKRGHQQTDDGAHGSSDRCADPSEANVPQERASGSASNRADKR
jgi:hypothetical protein